MAIFHPAAVKKFYSRNFSDGARPPVDGEAKVVATMVPPPPAGGAAPDSSTARRRLAAATLIGSDQTRPLRKALSHIWDLGGLIPVHLHLRPDAAAEEEVQ